MLHEFLADNRDELVARCRSKVALRPAPQPTRTELEHGIPIFLDQLIDALRSEQDAPRSSASKEPPEIGASAVKHGSELLHKGFTIDQVVHDYGDLCQSVTELAAEKHAPVTVDEFRTFNRCLDSAIADAVTEFGRERDQLISEEGARELNERLGSLAHELRNLLNSAMLAIQAIKSGTVALTGATGAVLDRSMMGLRRLVDSSLAEVRLTAGLQVCREPLPLADFFDQIRVAAAMEARDKGIRFSVSPVDADVAVHADRQMLGSAVANLLQNAFKFSRPNGLVVLMAHTDEDRVLIEIADECGGLAPGMIETIFHPFKQMSGDRTGLGLGLSISLRSIEANGGKLRVRDIPGTGCVFTIDLPLLSPAAK